MFKYSDIESNLTECEILKFQFVLSATPAISAQAKSSRIFSLFTDFK